MVSLLKVVKKTALAVECIEPQAGAISVVRGVWRVGDALVAQSRVIDSPFSSGKG